MPRPTEKISTLQLKTPSRIDLQSAQKAPAIPTVPKCLAKPETANLASEALESGQNKTQNLRRMTLSLAEGVVRARSLRRVVGAAKSPLKSDPGRAEG